MSSIWSLLVFVAIAFFIYRVFVPKKPPEMLCTTCLSIVHPKNLPKGSIYIEIILWLCFIVPGLIYSFWRLGSRQLSCPECGAAEFVPPQSLRAKQLISNAKP